jgi:hypothetical protein
MQERDGLRSPTGGRSQLVLSRRERPAGETPASKLAAALAGQDAAHEGDGAGRGAAAPPSPTSW